MIPNVVSRVRQEEDKLSIVYGRKQLAAMNKMLVEWRDKTWNSGVARVKLAGLFLMLEGCAVLGKAGRLRSARELFDIVGLPIPQKWQVNAGMPTKEGI